jgi:hypothetical protein
MTKKSVKGSAITNYLSDNTIDDYKPLQFEFSDEIIMLVEEEIGSCDDIRMFYFDRVINIFGNIIGAVLISLVEKLYMISIRS